MKIKRKANKQANIGDQKAKKKKQKTNSICHFKPYRERDSLEECLYTYAFEMFFFCAFCFHIRLWNVGVQLSFYMVVTIKNNS